MGLFDSLFGSHSSGNSSSTTNQTQVESGTQQQSGQTQQVQQTAQTQQQSSTGQTSSATEQNQSSAGQGVVSTLDQPTQDLLKGLLPQLTDNATAGSGDKSNSDALKLIASHLYDKATGGNAADVKAVTDAQSAQAKLDFQTGEGQQIGLTQQAIGSKDNTYSQLIEEKGNRDLATTLNTIAATGALNASQLDTGDFSAAITALRQASDTGATDANAAINPLLQVIQTLKGATSVSNTAETTAGASSTNTSTAEQQLASVLANINNQTQTDQSTSSTGTAQISGSSTGNQSGVASPGIVQSILGLFKT